MAHKQLAVYNGRKAINPMDFDSDVGWQVYSEADRSTGAAYFRQVPWLYRGVKGRSNDVGAMPFQVVQGESVKDESGKYENWLQFLPNPGRVFRLLEMSLAMTGKAYLFLETNPAGYIKGVQYCAPASIEVVRDKQTGEITGYKRTVGTQTFPVSPLNILAVYDPDYTTEDGPGNCSAAAAALLSAGVLYNADQFIADYFKRGAIKATVLSMEGGSQGEAERLQSWWERVVGGIKNAWSAVVLRSKGVTPTVIGEGLDSLQNETLTTERRQNIATALGVPESKMWSSAANYATRVEDEKAYYQGTIIPECELIAEAFNSQVFIKEHKLAGVRLEFLPETLPVMQPDKNQQAQGAKAFSDFLSACPTAEIAIATANLFGFQLSDELEAAIKKYYEEKEARAEEIQQNIANAQNNPPEPQPPESRQTGQNEEPPAEQEPPNPAEQKAALAAWKRKAIHAVERGESALVEFTSMVIPDRIKEALFYELAEAKTPEQVKAAFEAVKEENNGRVTPSLIAAIEGQLEAARNQADIQRILNDAVLWRGYP